MFKSGRQLVHFSGLKLQKPASRASTDSSPSLVAGISHSKHREPIRLDVWSDYACPFCYLEEPILNRIAMEYAGKVTLNWRAFELCPEPGTMLDPDGEYLHAIWNRAVYPMAQLRGMKLRLPPVQPRTRRAFEVAEFARAQGRFEQVHEALFRAFFQEGRDLSSLAVLMQIGAWAGVEIEGLRFALETGRYLTKVLEDEELAREIGLMGVPAIVFSRPAQVLAVESMVSGAQPYEMVQGTIDRLLKSEA